MVFYRGRATITSLQSIFGVSEADALWAGLYPNTQPTETLSLNREVLEALTPPYSGISFNLPTNDPKEQLTAKATLASAGIRFDETASPKPDSGNSPSQPRRLYWLTGSTLNRDIFRLVFEEIYGSPTLFGHRFFFAISPLRLNPEENNSNQRDFSRDHSGRCAVSTYFWRGLQLVSRELSEESIESLAKGVAARRGLALEVRNR